jgi:hypothetical protein
MARQFDNFQRMSLSGTNTPLLAHVQSAMTTVALGQVEAHLPKWIHGNMVAQHDNGN